MKAQYVFLLLIIPLSAIGQTLTGIVRNTDNQPLSGITVRLKGTEVKTSTDRNGRFKIPALPGAPSVLVFTATNMETHEREIKGHRYIEVVLERRLNKLDEIQIIGYGKSTQRFNVGSVSKLTADEIRQQPVANPLAALQGRVPGLVVTSTSGLPGSSFRVQLRGQNTLKSNLSGPAPIDNPLFIIDGVPYAAQNGNINQFPSINSPGLSAMLNNPHGGISPFNSISPDNIESIEVLRDADATAIYGSRGGNGVILITTKKGQVGKTAVNANFRYGISVIGNTMPMMNTQQYLQLRREAFSNDGIEPNMTLYDIGYAPDLLAFNSDSYTDWKDFFLGNTAHNTNSYIALSGGSAGTGFRLSADYNRDTYIFPGDYSDKRIGFASAINHRSADKRFSADFSATYSSNINNSSGSPSLLSAFTLEPNYPFPMDSNGNLIWDYNGVQLDGAYAAFNPIAYLKDKYRIKSNGLNSSLQLGYELFRGATLKTSLGYNFLLSEEYYGSPKIAQNPFNNPVARGRFGKNNFSTWIIEPQFDYNRNIGEATISILAGSTFQASENAKSEMSGSGYVNDGLIGSISGAPNRTATDAYSQYKYAAIFGRINLRFKNRYILNLNARRDGSSRFGPDRQFGNFGSVGVGWIFSEEGVFGKAIPALSYGKLRGSYGITGSDAIADYQFISMWAPSTYAYDGKIGYIPQNLANDKFGWASTKKLEFGLELGFFRDKVLLNASWYRNRSDNQLISYILPSQTGFRSVVENWNAVVQNTGLEFSLQSTNIKTANFSWNTALNLTVPENKLLSFPDIEQSSYSTTYIVGKSLNALNVFRYSGINPETGLFQFTDSNGNLTYTPVPARSGLFNDFQNIGDLDPKFYGGIQNSFRYKSISLDFFLEFRKQLGMNYLGQVYQNVPGWEFNQPEALTDRWSANGNTGDFQIVTSQFGQAASIARNSFVKSSGAYSDASYIRFKTISLSYNIPGDLCNRLGMERFRVYASAQNLFTITGYKGNDPETQNFYGVPPLRTIAFGTQITF